MVSKILRQNLLSDVANAPATVANPPKVIAPVATPELRKLLQQHARTATLQTLHHITDS